MSEERKNTDSNFEHLNQRINFLEKKISRIEELLNLRESVVPPEAASEHEPVIDNSGREGGMESKIGEFGLAWIGSVVLLFGISFLAQYIQNSGQPLFSAIFGFCGVAGILLSSHYLKNSYPYLSRMFTFISYLLLYYITLKLFFFTSHPLITEKFVVLVLLMIISGIQIFLSDKKKNESLSGIGHILLLVTAYLSKESFFMFSLVTFVAISSVFFLFRYGWSRLLLLVQFLVYFSFFIWFLNLPETEERVAAGFAEQNVIYFLFACVSAFSVITLIRQKGLFPDSLVFISVLLNGIFFSFILLKFVLTFYVDHYVGIFISIFVIAFFFSIILNTYSAWKFSPAFYALYGFISLSVALFGIYGFPFTYLLLSLQSLLVVSMAIWFRSRIIVIMNLFLFLILFSAYIFTEKSIDSINFSFAIIPMITARIINWKEDRLEIKTDLLRDVYLVLTFFTVLYSLFKALPGNYVTLSWTITALLYFALSILLKNVKYRWMAIFTMISTALYLFIVDLARIEIVYRIVAFMFLAIISIAVSMYYSRKKKEE